MSESDFQPDALRPEAADAIDASGQALLKEFVRRPLSYSPPPPFPSREGPVATITQADIVGEPLSAFSDFSGRITGRYFVENGEEVALVDAGYRALRLLAEKLLRAVPFKRGFSLSFIEETAFKWSRLAVRGQEAGSLSRHLLEQCGEVHGEHTILVPLAHVEIERDFTLGSAVVRTIDPSWFRCCGS